MRGPSIAIGTVLLIGVSHAHAQQTASAATPPAPMNDITRIEVASTGWRQMRVDLSYSLASAPANATVTARWMRKNGRKLAFAPVAATLARGAQHITLTTTDEGVLPPPNEIVMRVEMHGARGGVLAQYDCQLALLNASGKPAWAADVARGRPVRWASRRCSRR